MRPVLLLLVTVGCSVAEPPAGPSEPVAPAPATAPLALHMKEHFEWVVAARDAVIRGRPEQAVEPLKALAEHPIATEESAIDNDEAGGRAVALVAAQCGACHTAMGAVVTPPPVHVPEEDDTK